MYISIDMGGTYTRIASSKDLKSIYKSVKFNTKKTLIDQKNSINYEIKKLSENTEISAICLGVPGTLDRANKKFLKLPNYKELDGQDFNYLFNGELHAVPLVVVNDAHMAGYKEAVDGAGKDYNTVLYITIGTGIGGVLINDKDLDDIFENFEPGHDYVFDGGIDLEGYCSGRNFHRIYNVPIAAQSSEATWKEYSHNLSEGLSFLKSKYSADVIVLGGGFSINNYQLFNKYLPTTLNTKFIEFGDSAGILGGFLILKNYTF
jgi:predicted NBD/HSP70 family sugar kinase